MRPVTAFESDDGELFRTAADAKRRDDAALAKPLVGYLHNCVARAKEAGLGEEYGLLEFLRKNAAAIRSFLP